MKRKVQMRWSDRTFRIFRSFRCSIGKADKHEKDCISVCFRTFRCPGIYGKLLFPPFREETTYKGVKRSSEVSASVPGFRARSA